MRTLNSLAVVLVLSQWVLLPAAASYQTAQRTILTQLAEKISPLKDVFASLTEQQKKAWAFDDGKTINETLQSINNVPVKLLVDVKLVGFNGDGNEKIVVSEAELAKYLHALPTELPSVALEPNTDLAVKPSVLFRVEKVSTLVHNRIESALGHALNAAMAGDHYLHNAPRIPVSVIDNIIDSEFRAGEQLFTLYILNPTVTGQESYLYQYDDDPRPVSELSSSCPGPLYVGKKAYAWVDLSATVRYYGPGAGHKGQVYVHSFPYVNEYKTHVNHRAILPDLVNLIWSACQHLVWPPVLHLHSEAPPQHLDIQVVHLHDTLVPPGHRTMSADIITRELQSSPLGEVTSVRVTEKWHSFSLCNLCVSAYNNALRQRTSRALLPMVQGKTSKFLDSRALYQLMKSYQYLIMAEAGLHLPTEKRTDRRVLPVFVFDMYSDDVVLLDYNKQAVAFEDMILAVRTRAPEADSNFVCDYRHVFLDGLNLTRPILAAVLQSAAALTDTHVYYTNATGENVDYKWSVGSSLFGPLSSSTSMSGVDRALTLRNLALTHVQQAVNRTSRILTGLAKVSKTNMVKDAVPREHLTTYRQRMNVLQFKLQEAALHLRHANGKLALLYAQSMMRDVDALEALMVRLQSVLVPTLSCQGTVIATWQLWAPPLGAAVMLAAACVYRVASAERKAKVY